MRSRDCSCRGAAAFRTILSLKDPNHHPAENTNREPIEDRRHSSLTVISAEPRVALLTRITISVTGQGGSDLAQIFQLYHLGSSSRSSVVPKPEIINRGLGANYVILLR